MTRRQSRLEQISVIEREYAVALTAAEDLDERLRRNPSALDGDQLQVGDYQNFRNNLEPTYLIRVFAEFEAGLREAWEFAFYRITLPKTHDLIESIAAQRTIAGDWIASAHEVRIYRNALVHEGGGAAPAVPIQVACHYLRRFFSRLPHRW